MTATTRTALIGTALPTDRLSVPQSAAAGLGLGLAWGIAARIWMRLISTNPEFSWSGTGFIVGSTAIGGLVLGLMYGIRLAGRTRWWRLLIVIWLPILAGPGMPFLPPLLLGGLLFGSRRRWLKAVGAVAILSATILLWRLDKLSDEPTDGSMLCGGFLLLSLALAAGSAELYRSRPPQPGAVPAQSQAAGRV
jgi:hypothetical protein